MAKSKEELTALTTELETVTKKLRQLTPEELEFVSGGFLVDTNGNDSTWRKLMDCLFKIAN